MKRRVTIVVACSFAATLSFAESGLPSAQATTSAQYVVVIQGDGMGPKHVDAGRYYINGDTTNLVFEDFPGAGTMTHNNASGGTTDSAASASAMATGIKTNNGVISQRTPGDGAEMRTLLEMYRNVGLRTGLVTTAYATDASPAAYGAHDPSRNNTSAIFADHMAQSRPNVILGGGGNGLSTSMAADRGYDVVTTRTALLGLNPDNEVRTLGGFGGEIMDALDIVR